MLVLLIVIAAAAGVLASVVLELISERDQMDRLVTRVTAKPRKLRHTLNHGSN